MALRSRIAKCKSKVASCSKDWKGTPDAGKWLGRHRGPEIANVIKRIYHISIRFGEALDDK